LKSPSPRHTYLGFQESGPRPNVNPELDSFEAVMKALDAELSREKSKKPSAQPSSLKGGKS